MRFTEIHVGAEYAVNTSGSRHGHRRRARVLREVEVEYATSYAKTRGFEVEILTNEGEPVHRGEAPLTRRLHSRAFIRTWEEEVAYRAGEEAAHKRYDAQREAARLARAERGRPIVEALRERLGADWGAPVPGLNRPGQAEQALEGTRGEYLELTYAELERLLGISREEVVSEG